MSTSTKVFRRECLLLARTTEATPTSSAFQLAGNGSAPRGLGSPTTAGFAALLSQAHGSREGQGRPPQAWTLAQGLLAPAAPQDGGARDPPSATPATALCRLPEQRRAQKSHHARLSRDGWPYYSACLLAPHVLQIPESLQFSKQLPWWCYSFFFFKSAFLNNRSWVSTRHQAVHVTATLVKRFYGAKPRRAGAARVRTYHGQLPPDVAHGDASREEDTRQPGANIEKVWGRVPAETTEETVPSIHDQQHF